MSLFVPPNARATDANGGTLSAAEWHFFLTGSDTPTDVYTTSVRDVAHSNPVVADAGGNFASIYLDPAVTYRAVLKRADGTTIRDIDPYSQAATLSDLSASTGAGLIGWIRAATGAVARTVADMFEDRISVMDFIPLVERVKIRLGTSTADLSSYFTAMSTHAKTLPQAHVVVPAGTYNATSKIILDLPDYSTCEWYGKLVSTVSGASALVVGSETVRRTGYKVTGNGLWVDRATYDTSSGSNGIEIRDVQGGEITVRRVLGFETGLKLNGVLGGVQYNKFYLGLIHDNKINMRLTASGVGWCNENVYVGGSFNHSGTYPDYTGTINLQIDHYAGNVLNNNKFVGLSLEGNSLTTKAAVINGENNYLLYPRLENSAGANFIIEFTANAQDCGIDGRGFGVIQAAISDSGTRTNWIARDGAKEAASVSLAANQAVRTFQSTAANDAKLIRGLDTADVETWNIDGQGIGYFAIRAYFHQGIRWRTSSGSLNDRGLFTGDGSPEGVVTADPGSLYSDTAGGLWSKESGGGNTGWKRIGYQAASVAYAAGANPTKAEFDAVIDALKATKLMA